MTSSPSGATIFLNEKNTNLKTPADIKALEPEIYHSIGLFLDDYKFWSRDVILKPNESKSLSIKLALDYGSLAIVSIPVNANVLINKKLIGKTPLKKGRLKPGKILEITVMKPGFKHWSEKVQIKPGKTLTLRPRLLRTKEMMVPRFLRNLKESNNGE